MMYTPMPGHPKMVSVRTAPPSRYPNCAPMLHPPEAQMTQRLTDELLARGLYTRVVLDCICIAPPLVITEAELDRLVNIIGDTVGAVMRSGRVAAG